MASPVMAGKITAWIPSVSKSITLTLLCLCVVKSLAQQGSLTSHELSGDISSSVVDTAALTIKSLHLLAAFKLGIRTQSTVWG
eukprot:CAMPEP_0118656966 /NCGR_PEP_ID=MMETSP0785-20121206/13761_1 /TAXON_ID=91992 /ORGANISM="Bolidomonas pacifica, Strain CCMP 1866" /LENGTH=82 /DNA_ID=CAMNT_0006549841 /DNA_START=127 /DNA_END=375 /DNA_ORIENTATION=+